MSAERKTWCPYYSRHERGECGWPRCQCPDEGDGWEQRTAADGLVTAVEEIARLRAALEVFADAARKTDELLYPPEGDDMPIQFTLGDCRAAVKALEA